MESINMFQCHDDNYEGEPDACSTSRCINEDEQQTMQERKKMICIEMRQEFDNLVNIIEKSKKLKKNKRNQMHVNKLLKMKHKLFKDMKSIETNSKFLNNEILSKIIKPTRKLNLVDKNDSENFDVLESLTRQLTKKEAELSNEKEITEKLTYKNHVLKQILTSVASDYQQQAAKFKNDIEIKDDELKKCKEEIANIMLLQATSQQEAQLKNKLKTFESELRIYEIENQLSSSSTSETITKEEQAKHQAAQEHDESTVSLHKYLAELQERLSKLETTFRETQMKIVEEDKNLRHKIQENKCLQNHLSSTTFRANDIKNSLRLKLQVEFLEKEYKYQKASGEKLRILREKLYEAKEELYNSMSKQFSQKAEHSAILETLTNEISSYKQKIFSLEEKWNSLEHESDDLKKKLEKVTQDRDEKIQEISKFVKLFDDLKILADASAAEKSRLGCEKIALQKEANEARRQLEERDNLQSQSANLQEKLEETIKVHQLQVSSQKQVESELKKQISKLVSECKEAISAKNKIMHEKEIAIQHIKVTEKELGIKKTELNMIPVQVTDLQEKNDMLTAKLNKCEEVIKRVNIASEKLQKENQDQAQNILNLEHHIKVLNDNLSQKEKEIALTKQHCHTLNNVDQSLEESVNECTKLKILAEKLFQNQNELMDKYRLLEDNLKQFEIKLENSTKQVLSLEEEKKNLIKSMNELTNENSLLHEATGQLALLEMDKSSQNNKLRHLTDKCMQLDEELKILRKELISSQETKHVLEKHKESFMKIQADLRSRCCTLTEDNMKLRESLVSETLQRQKLYIEAERLKCIHASVSSNAEKMAKENNEICKLLAQREAKIEKLQFLNKKFVKKLNDLQLSYNKNMEKKKSEAIENVKECASLRLKNQGLLTKITNHIRMNKQMKEKCQELDNETENKNIVIKNLKRENEEIQVENQKLKREKIKMVEVRATHRKDQEQPARHQQELVKLQSKKKPPSQQPKRESVPSRTHNACTRVKQLVKRD